MPQVLSGQGADGMSQLLTAVQGHQCPAEGRGAATEAGPEGRGAGAGAGAPRQSQGQRAGTPGQGQGQGAGAPGEGQGQGQSGGADSGTCPWGYDPLKVLKV